DSQPHSTVSLASIRYISSNDTQNRLSSYLVSIGLTSNTLVLLVGLIATLPVSTCTRPLYTHILSITLLFYSQSAKISINIFKDLRRAYRLFNHSHVYSYPIN